MCTSHHGPWTSRLVAGWGIRGSRHCGCRVVRAAQPSGDDDGEDTTEQRADDVRPEILEVAGHDRRSDRASRVHRSPVVRAADGRNGRDVGGDRERDVPGVELRPIGHAKHHDDETEGQDDLEEHRLDVLTRLRVRACQVAGGPEEQEGKERTEDRSGDLDDQVDGGDRPFEFMPQGKREAHRRVEVGGEVAQEVDRSREPQCGREGQQRVDGPPGHVGVQRERRRAGPEDEHEPGDADELREESANAVVPIVAPVGSPAATGLTATVGCVTTRVPRSPFVPTRPSVATGSATSRVARSSAPPRQSRCATRPVQPVWCEAPMPAPVSPWKYSWKSSRSRHSGSVRKRSMRAVDRSMAFTIGQPDRRPGAATGRRRRRAGASARPEPVGYSTVNASPRPSSQRSNDSMNR